MGGRTANADPCGYFRKKTFYEKRTNSVAVRTNIRFVGKVPALLGCASPRRPSHPGGGDPQKFPRDPEFCNWISKMLPACWNRAADLRSDRSLQPDRMKWFGCLTPVGRRHRGCNNLRRCLRSPCGRRAQCTGRRQSLTAASKAPLQQPEEVRNSLSYEDPPRSLSER